MKPLTLRNLPFSNCAHSCTITFLNNSSSHPMHPILNRKFHLFETSIKNYRAVKSIEVLCLIHLFGKIVSKYCFSYITSVCRRGPLQHMLPLTFHSHAFLLTHFSPLYARKYKCSKHRFNILRCRIRHNDWPKLPLSTSTNHYTVAKDPQVSHPSIFYKAKGFILQLSLALDLQGPLSDQHRKKASKR